MISLVNATPDQEWLVNQAETGTEKALVSLIVSYDARLSSAFEIIERQKSEIEARKDNVSAMPHFLREKLR